MTRIEAEQFIADFLFGKMISHIEDIFSDVGRLRNRVKYDCERFNESLAGDFKQVVEVLKGVVDKFYWRNYEIEGFIPFYKESLDDENWFNSILDHNAQLLRNAKKLIEFIE